MDTTTSTTTAPFIAYEYDTVQVPRDKEALYRDTYAAFGWTVDSYETGAMGAHAMTLKLKRDRTLRSRPVLLELQRSAETALRSISNLERSRTTLASVWAMSIGVVGAALLGGSVFALEGGLGVLMVILGAVGIIGWILPWFVHRTLKSRRTAQVVPLIDREYDIVYDACTRAASLIG